MTMLTRRKFLALAGLALPSALGADALREPTSLRITKLTLNPASKLRFVHFSDFHYKGDADYASEVIRTINSLAPEFVVFTGDLIEEKQFASAALDFIRAIERPVFGAPGNHDYWCGAPFAEYERAFRATGGDWLVDRTAVVPKHQLEIVGMGVIGIHALREARAPRRIALNHYPIFANELRGRGFDLILSGHSHGGQVRVPFYGAVVLPSGVGHYDLGYFDTPGGPLYVSAGIGTYYLPFRINCRPEVTVVTL